MEEKNRITLLSTLLEKLFLLSALVIPLIVIVFWLAINRFMPHDIRSCLTPEREGLDMMTKLIAIGTTIICNIPQILMLLALSKVFHYYRKGEYFSLSAVSQFRKVSFFAFLSIVGDILNQTLITSIVSWGNLEGKRLLSFGVSSNQIKMLLFALTLVVIASIMEKAHSLEEENSLTI